jgi:hypothetical protein
LRNKAAHASAKLASTEVKPREVEAMLGDFGRVLLHLASVYTAAAKQRPAAGRGPPRPGA